MVVSVSVYDQFIEFVGDGGIDLDSDTFKGELYNATHIFTAANTIRANIAANALATAFGYTNPGQNLAGVTWQVAAGGTVFDANDVVWTAAGGSIGPARHLIIYDDTSTVPGADLLVCDVDFGVNETATDGTDFKITWNALGIFKIT